MAVAKNTHLEDRINDIENSIICLVISAALYVSMLYPIKPLLNILGEYYYLLAIFLFSVFWFSIALYVGRITSRVSERTIIKISPTLNSVLQIVNIYYFIFAVAAIFGIHYFTDFSYKQIIGGVAIGFLGNKILPRIFKKS